MIRRRHEQRTLGEVVLFGTVVPNVEALMDPQLLRIDDLLEDETLVDEVLAVLRRRFPHSARRGRKGTPAEVVLRLLTLKHLKGWSYDQLEWEVTGNLVYRRFCRIDAGKVPDAKTMVRHGQLLDGPSLRRLFDRIVAMAVERSATKGSRMRVDTTVVEAPIRHPTDSGLCEDGIRVIGRSIRRLLAAGVKLPFKLRSVVRSVSRRMTEIAAAARLKRDARGRALQRPYRALLRITGRVVRQATKTIDAAKQQSGGLQDAAQAKVERALSVLETMMPRARQVLRQTRARILRGETKLPGKIISLFEPWAQILRRGKPHQPTEFGMLVKVQEADGGVVTDIATVPEKADAPLLVPSVEHHIKVFGRAPRIATTDRGFYSGKGERKIRELGVTHAAIPKPGYRGEKRIEYERQRWFRRARAWRAGGEARISRLKHQFGMVRSRYRGDPGLLRTVFWAAMANNLVAVAVRGT